MTMVASCQVPKNRDKLNPDLLRAAKRNNFENKQLIIDMILSGADIKQQAILRTRVYDTLSYYLPIPERELIYNQNLVQNPFYDR